MTHLDEAIILRIRDGELVASSDLQHAEDCSECASALAAAGRRATRIEGALEALEADFDVMGARESVRARLDRTIVPLPKRSGPKRSGTFGAGHLGRAAAFLVLAAGALSALPGSPVRTWLIGPPELTDEPQNAESPGIEREPVGFRVPVTGPVEVRVTGAEPGTNIQISWTDERVVSIYAAPGSSFGTPAGRVDASVTAGSVRVELPRAGSPLSLSVNGLVYLLRTEAGLRTPGPTTQEMDGYLRFVVPGA